MALKKRMLHSLWAAVSTVIFSFCCTTLLLAHYIRKLEDQRKGQHLTVLQSLQSLELEIPADHGTSGPWLQPQEPFSPTLVSRHSLSYNSRSTDNATDSHSRSKRYDGIEQPEDSGAGSILGAWSAHKTPASPLPESQPTEVPVITSSLYTSGHDIVAPNLCPGAGSEMRVLILVNSAPRNVDARTAIRHTWGHFGARKDVSVGFFVGSSSNSYLQRLLEMESGLHGDIIRARLRDSYKNLTLKTISMLEWVDTHCPRVRFILKTDDDVFINVPRLLTFTEIHFKKKKVIFGRVIESWKPVTNRTSRYYVPVQKYKHGVHTAFATGPAYLLSNDTVRDLYETSLNKTYLHLEDVLITGIVAAEAKIKLVHSLEFPNRRVPLDIPTAGITVHDIQPSEQLILLSCSLGLNTMCTDRNNYLW